jgi:hypothetical protein
VDAFLDKIYLKQKMKRQKIMELIPFGLIIVALVYTAIGVMTTTIIFDPSTSDCVWPYVDRSSESKNLKHNLGIDNNYGADECTCI